MTMQRHPASAYGSGLVNEEPPPGDLNRPEEVLYEDHPALVPSVGWLMLAIFTVGLGLIYLWFRRASVHYKITTERVVIETGLLSKKMNQIDIYRINDYVVERPFGQRLMGTGNIVVSAMDATDATLKLGGLKTDVKELYERLRTATENEKRRRGVRMVDYE